MSKSLNGVHVKHHKNTENDATQIMPIPDKVIISMSQHMGAPCEVAVKVGEEVKVGQIVGNQNGFISAPIHSGVSGKVSAIQDVILSNGMRAKAVAITTDKEQTVCESVAPPTVTNHAEFVEAIKLSGLVGLGGAGFPAYVKFSPKNLEEVDTLVVNAAECEPYITSDYRCMIEDTDDVIEGMEILKKYLNLKNLYIGIEDNKPEAIKLFNERFKGKEGFKVFSLKSLYPQGGEKVLIYETTGKVVPEGKLPADVGVIVSNVASVAFVSKYIKTGMPLVTKRITVDGGAVAEKKNIIAPVGTLFKDVFDFCGGFKEDPAKIIMGGPMMGIAIRSLDDTLLKNNNAVLAFTEEETKEKPETPCIRCGKCISACPFNLMPAGIEKNYKAKDEEGLKKLKVNLCMECGCCAYVCPAKRNLVVVNKLAKKLISKR